MKTQKTKPSGREDDAATNEAKDSSKKKVRKPDAVVVEKTLAYQLTPPPKEFATTTDGQSAVACLKQLHDAGLIGDIEWTTELPSTSSYATFNPTEHELVRLTIQKGEALQEPLVYEQDRLVNLVSRQALKQHLATFAVCDIVGPELHWSDLSFKELRQHVTQKMLA